MAQQAIQRMSFYATGLAAYADSSSSSAIMCDHWWHLKIIAFECHQGSASVKIKDIVCSWKPGTTRLAKQT